MPSTNNSSEPAMCLSPVLRKVTNGLRAEWGRDLLAAVRSVVRTGKRHGPCTGRLSVGHGPIRGRHTLNPTDVLTMNLPPADGLPCASAAAPPRGGVTRRGPVRWEPTHGEPQAHPSPVTWRLFKRCLTRFELRIRKQDHCEIGAKFGACRKFRKAVAGCLLDPLGAFEEKPSASNTAEISRRWEILRSTDAHPGKI
jgi:hypothetical protein